MGKPSSRHTRIDCGVVGRGLVFVGHLTRHGAIANARRHYEKELAKIQDALDALDENRVQVTYLENGEPTSRLCIARNEDGN